MMVDETIAKTQHALRRKMADAQRRYEEARRTGDRQAALAAIREYDDLSRQHLMLTTQQIEATWWRLYGTDECPGAADNG